MAKIAIIETGGKQHVVSDGAVITIEKLKGEHKIGDTVTFGNVLMTDDGSAIKTGAPFIDGISITGEIVAEGRAKTVRVIRYRPKSRSFKKNGHRQPFLKVKINTV